MTPSAARRLATAVALSAVACAGTTKKTGPADRIIEPNQYLVRVPDEEGWMLAKVVGSSTETLKRVELVATSRRMLAEPLNVRAALPEDLKPGAVVFWTNESGSGKVNQLRRATWKRGLVRRVEGTRVWVGDGNEADAGWQVLVPLAPVGTSTEPRDPDAPRGKPTPTPTSTPTPTPATKPASPPKH